MDRIRFEERDGRFTAHVARLRAEVMLTTSVTALALVQYISAEDVVVTNFRFRYNPREGNDLYIVWNEGLNSDRFARDPVQPLGDRRTNLVKYAHTLTYGT